MPTFQVFTMQCLKIVVLIIGGWCAIVSGRGVNGGMSCAVCTVLMGVAMQVAEIKEESIANATKRLCTFLPGNAKKECLSLVEDVEPLFLNISKKATPDLLCIAYGTCKVDPGQPLCHLFPLPFMEEEFLETAKKMAISANLVEKIDVCTFSVIKDICRILNNSYTSLKPAQDHDEDGFSIISSARGFDWKGRDCNDNNPDIYPGRLPYKMDVGEDSNCNGIYGMDTKTNTPWEEVLCKGSKPSGLIYIGDSIGAHFHMPQIWINPIEFTWPSLNASDVILDELDWPQFGFATGYKNISDNILIKGAVDSLYLRLKKRNRCNHRDYQNLSQNGASSFEGIEHAKSVNRNQTVDSPAIVIYAMQGNDVCNNFQDTIAHMTPPKVFEDNIMKTLDILNGKLPRNSHVLLMGLVNGKKTFSQMAERLHPIGVLHNNVHYKNVYDWFNCMQIGPCTGWLNSNETVRSITSEKAGELTDVLKRIVKNQNFEYFNLHFVENPINQLIFDDMINIPDLLEAVDSLHPNQRAQPLLATKLWKQMLNDLPKNVLGPTNVFNAKIKKLFGDQGGY
ncbi:unnamed protein product [Brassicogethes aeneus]|uniref:Saposin B-type domain-containing protein n=1 Tax=Brassicogethes aeneus TaxID=1431903 RepID=A0A9P0FJD3_BRAAE|nr:unnamed protein product [Brassicogethes aeneus]